MDAYTAFSKVYDKLMENIPYELWADRIDGWIREYGISKPVRDASDPLESERNLVLDLGCGTGVLTRLMYNKGYDLIGVDISAEMLDVARQKEPENGDSPILYICQDMCELDLYSTIGTVYSSCDSINYLLEDEEVKACFDGVSKFLYPGGLFIFDFNTVYKYRDVIGETTIAENAGDVSFIWENCFDDESHVNECDLTLFIRDEDNSTENELYIKQEETHYQRGFTLDEMRDFLEKSGLSLVKAVDEREILGEAAPLENAERTSDDENRNIPFENAERIFIIARKTKEEI